MSSWTATSSNGVVSSLPKGRQATVALTADDQKLTITSADAVWSLRAIPAEGYPSLPPLPPEAGIVDGEAFARSVTRVAAVAAKSSKQQYNLTCLQVPAHAAGLSLGATDTLRAAADEVPWTSTGPAAETREILVPALAATAFAKKAGQSGKVTVHLSGDLVAFRDDAREMTVRTMAGESGYDQVRGLFRDESPVTLTADAIRLAAVLRRMGKVTAAGHADPGTPEAVTLRYTGRAVSLTVLGETGQPLVTESMSAEVTGAEEFEVSFSALHLASLLSGITGQVVIGLAGSLPESPRPLMINGAGADPFKAMLAPIPKAPVPAKPRR